MKVHYGKTKKTVLLLWLVLFISCLPTEKKTESLVVDFWYGDNQVFGAVGIAQKWINILGSIAATNAIKEAYYQLNNGEKQSFTLGSDLHRLASKGDFNIDLDLELCKEGRNDLVVFVSDSLGNSTRKTLHFKVLKSNKWPLPYSVEWNKTKNVQKVVQVVDGKWKITADGIRNTDRYYDRVLALGDSSWRNYEVRTSVIFHDFEEPKKGPPTYNVSHAAIASRWPGHDTDSLQPHRKWYPLGATAEFRLTKELDSCRWRIFDGPKKGIPFYEEEDITKYRKIELNKPYGMIHRVETTQPHRTRYSVKLWPLEKEEPAAWDFIAEEAEENIDSGAALLIAHNTSVTFGNIYATPVIIENEKP